MCLNKSLSLPVILTAGLHKPSSNSNLFCLTAAWYMPTFANHMVFKNYLLIMHSLGKQDTFEVVSAHQRAETTNVDHMSEAHSLEGGTTIPFNFFFVQPCYIF